MSVGYKPEEGALRPQRNGTKVRATRPAGLCRTSRCDVTSRAPDACKIAAHAAVRSLVAQLLQGKMSAEGRTRTCTGVAPQGILSPLRLPISPPRPVATKHLTRCPAPLV